MNPLRTYLDEMLLDKRAGEALETVHKNGLLTAVFPELRPMMGFGGDASGHKDLWAHTKKVVTQVLREPHLRWAALFHDIAKPQCFTKKEGVIAFHGHEAEGARIFRAAAKRTRLFSKDEVQTISFIIRHLGHVEGYSPDWTDSAIRRLLLTAGDRFDDLCALARADITTKKKDKRARIIQGVFDLRTRAHEIRRQDAIPPALPKGLGNALMTHLNLGPSKELGIAMNLLKQAVEEGRLSRQPSIEEALDYYDRDIRR